MKKISLCLFAFLLINISLSAKSTIPVSRWKKIHEMKIDGNDNDWVKPINFYDDKTGMFFAFSNDSSTLYLNFTVTDPQKISRLIHSGWSINFLTKNKKGKTKASIVFASPQGGGGDMRSLQDGNNEKGTNNGTNHGPGKKTGTKIKGKQPEQLDSTLLRKRTIIDYKKQLESFTAKGFLYTHDEVPIQSSTGISICVGESNPSGLLYEIAIPLNELYKEGSVTLKELIAFSVLVNASSKSEGAGGKQGGPGGGMPGGGGEMMGGPGGDMGGGGGMPGGGEMMGGSGPGGGGMRGEASGKANSSSGKITFKQKFTLASK
jgi:hypothetical protein